MSRRAQRTLRDGIHVVRIGDALMVKRLAASGRGQATLLSENAAYPPIAVALGELDIIGRVRARAGAVVVTSSPGIPRRSQRGGQARASSRVSPSRWPSRA